MPKHTKRKLKKTRARRRTLRGGNNTGNTSKESVSVLAQKLKIAESSFFQKSTLAKRLGLDNNTGLHTFLSKLNDSGDCSIKDKTRDLVNDYIKNINQVNKDALIYNLLEYTCIDKNLYNLCLPREKLLATLCRCSSFTRHF